jgi:hypothetical protein
MAPAEALNWNLDRESLLAAVTDQIRRGDDIPLKLLMDGALERANQILRADPDVEGDELAGAQEDVEGRLGTHLDQLIAVAARGIAVGRREVIDPTSLTVGDWATVSRSTSTGVSLWITSTAGDYGTVSGSSSGLCGRSVG